MSPEGEPACTSPRPRPRRAPAWMASGPVVMGGVGGSGTRAVATLVQRLGYYLGSDLNEAVDNLWFTLLFKRPRWFYRTRHLGAQVERGLGILEKAMAGDRRYSPREYAFLLRAAGEVALFGHDHRGSGKGGWAIARLGGMLRGPGPAAPPGCRGWGWKEPSSHLFLEGISRRFPGCRYLHVIRHGLDMAFSANQAQLFNWGRHFSVALPRTPDEVPRASLEYWARANTRAIEVGRALLGDRFLLVDFDALCLRPEVVVRRVADHLGAGPLAPERLEALCAPLRNPQYLGRYRQHDLAQFPPDGLEAVRRLGYEVVA